jgi:regulator of sigma E protease
MIEILTFLFFLNLIIFVHEFGHFLFAKKFKIPVLHFSLGFPPFIFTKKIGETLYSLGFLLFGGFVKLKGEEEVEEGGFLASPPKVRFLIALGGILMNILLAYFLFSLSYLISFPQSSNKVIITGFLEESQFKNVFKKGDIIKSVEKDGEIFYFKSPQEVSSFLRENLGKKVLFLIEREGKEEKIEIVIPEKPLRKNAVLGVYLSNFELVRKPFPLNFLSATYEIFKQTKNIFLGFSSILKGIFFKEKVQAEVVGPVGIFSYYRNIQEFGLGYVLYFIGTLSLYLAFFNLLPFPALDGGRIIFILFEAIFKKRLKVKFEALIHTLGFVFLFLILIFITLKDVLKLFE